MLGTRDLNTISVVMIPHGAPEGVLVVCEGQVIGGGIASPTIEGTAVATATLSQRWAVSDLIASDWHPLSGVPGAEFVLVPAEVPEAVRAALERFHADGVRRINAEVARRQGVMDALAVVTGVTGAKGG